MYLILFFRNDLPITPLALFILTTKCLHLFRSAEIAQTEQTVHLHLCFHTFCHRINTPLPYKTHNMPGSLFTHKVPPLIQYLSLRRNNRPTDSILLMKYANGIIYPFAMCQRTSNLTPDMANLMKKPPAGYGSPPLLSTQSSLSTDIKSLPRLKLLYFMYLPVQSGHQ